jgi:hypothetical protein
LGKTSPEQRFGFSSVPSTEGGLEITRVDRGGLLAKWNTERRDGGPRKMVGVGDIIRSVNSAGPEDVEAMRMQLDNVDALMRVAKVRS